MVHPSYPVKVIGLELLHSLAAVDAVASIGSLVIAYLLDDFVVNMGQMVSVAVASFDEHLVDPVDEAFLYYNQNK